MTDSEERRFADVLEWLREFALDRNVNIDISLCSRGGIFCKVEDEEGGICDTYSGYSSFGGTPQRVAREMRILANGSKR